MFIPRNIHSVLSEALSTSPVVLLHGARQTGKSTLVQSIAKEKGFDYVTLDDFTVLNAAEKDPAGFLKRYDRPLIIDEVQKAPQLFPAIKLLVDNDRKPGRYLLTGSANVLMLPKLSESLAGRMEIITLRPFSCDELVSRKTHWIDSLFSSTIPMKGAYSFSRTELITTIAAGGYPEIQKLGSAAHQEAWFNSYIETMLQRDIRNISQITNLYELHRMLTLIAAQSGSFLNMSSMSRDTGLVLMTLKRYLAILEAAFLVNRIPAWFRNIGKRLIKAPKLYLNDTGLLGYLAGFNSERLRNEPQQLGRMLESFVMQELFKQASWSQTKPTIHYYRSVNGREIDFILENRSGELVGIEVKAAASVSADSFSAMQELQVALGKSFLQGIVLYLGEQTVPFGERLSAVPVSCLWTDLAD